MLVPLSCGRRKPPSAVLVRHLHAADETLDEADELVARIGEVVEAGDAIELLARRVAAWR
jgi:hypothetical protein